MRFLVTLSAKRTPLILMKRIARAEVIEKNVDRLLPPFLLYLPAGGFEGWNSLTVNVSMTSCGTPPSGSCSDVAACPSARDDGEIGNQQARIVVHFAEKERRSHLGASAAPSASPGCAPPASAPGEGTPACICT